MPFVDALAQLSSVSVVGLSKNAGKTETLNYIIERLSGQPKEVALTSIGIDGERVDQVTQTAKPEICVPVGMRFVTAEAHYRLRQLTSVVTDVSPFRTSLGRLICARAAVAGKVLLSGPASTGELKRLIQRLATQGVELTLVDGALSRLSLASPAVTQGLVLATGAAVSSNLPELVRSTAYVHHLISLPQVEEALRSALEEIQQGVWAIDSEGQVHDLEIPSVFLLAKAGKDLFRYGRRIYVAGAVSDRVFDILRGDGAGTEIVVQDFTRVFASPRSFYVYEKTGGRVSSLLRNELLAITVNPQAPSGYRLDSAQLCEAISSAIGRPVYDVRNLRHRMR